MALIDKLRTFSDKNKEDFTVTNLTAEFKDIAKTILYDGYIQVRNNYRVYIKTVEFYFHAEKESKIRIFDPIVYHRNEKFPNRTVPYFPLMTLHAHASGFDITFENEKQKYRASALIRQYAIFDLKTKKFIRTKEEHYKESNIEKIPYDKRSTFLYDFINGFPLNKEDNNIVWIDSETSIAHDLEPSKQRLNVYIYKCYCKENGQEVTEKTKEKDTRRWSFTRANDINP